jgi:hypothetical protein
LVSRPKPPAFAAPSFAQVSNWRVDSGHPDARRLAGQDSGPNGHGRIAFESPSELRYKGVRIERSPEGLAAPQMRCRFAILFLGAGLRAPGVGLTFRLNVIICTRVNVGIEVAVVAFNQSCLLRLIAASLPLPLN